MYSEACSHYLIVIQRVLVDESLDEFFRSDVAQSFLKREEKKSENPRTVRITAGP